MEYLIGAAITMISYIIANRIAGKQRDRLLENSEFKITYSQSHIYELMKPYIDMVGPIEEKVNRQSANYLKNVYLRIMVVENKAYWIKDNRFIVAEIVNGEIDKENAQEVDTMNMNKVELDEMMFIVEKLREGDDDSRGSGK